MMVVLRVIPSKWRLFCVLEVIGLSGTFALLGLRATENGSEVSESYLAGCNYGIRDVVDGCYIYSWFFILTYHPVTVTILSLLVNAIVTSPKGFMRRHLFGKCFFKDWSFTTLFALWILGEGFYRFFLDEWLFEAYVLFFASYAAALVVWLVFATYKHFARGGSQGSTVSNSNTIRWTWSRNMGLFYMPVALFLLGIVVVVIAAASGTIGSEVDLLNPTWDPFLVTEAVYSLLYNLWLVWAVCKKATSVTLLLPEVVTVAAEVQEPVVEHQGLGSRRLSPLSRDLLLGWAHANGLYVAFSLCLSEIVLPFIERTGITWAYLPLFATYWFAWTWIGVCAAASNTKGVAFWAVASWLLYYVAYCMWIWYQAVMSGSVK